MAAMRQTWTDHRMDDLAKSVDARFEQVDKCFEQVDERFEQIHGDIKGLREETNQHFATLNRRFDVLMGVLLAASLSGVVTVILS